MALLADTFTDTNGTALTSHTPDAAPIGASWANPSVSKFSIQNGTLQRNYVTQVAAWAYIDAGAKTFDCTGTYHTNSETEIWNDFIFCLDNYDDFSHYYQVRFRYQEGGDQYVRISEYSDIAEPGYPVEAILGQVDNVYPEFDTTYQIMVRVNLGKVTLFIDTVQVLDVNSFYNDDASKGTIFYFYDYCSNTSAVTDGYLDDISFGTVQYVSPSSPASGNKPPPGNLLTSLL